MEKENRYQKVVDLPNWAQPASEKLVDKGKIADGNKLNLTMDMVRALVILGM